MRSFILSFSIIQLHCEVKNCGPKTVLQDGFWMAQAASCAMERKERKSTWIFFPYLHCWADLPCFYLA